MCTGKCVVEKNKTKTKGGYMHVKSKIEKELKCVEMSSNIQSPTSNKMCAVT